MTLVKAVAALTGWRRLVLALAAGAATAFAFAPFYALPLMAVGYAVFVLLLDGASSSPRPRRAAFAVGWCFGFGFHLLGVYWMAFSFFVQADQFAWMAPFVVLGMPAFLALFMGGAGTAAIIFWRPGWRRVLVFAAAMMVFEYARGRVLTGLPWNLPAQAFAGTALGAQSAAFIGAYGLSLLVVLLAAAPAAFEKPLKGAAVTLIGAALLFAAGALRLMGPGPGVQEGLFVRIIQPNIPQREKIDWDLYARNFQRHVALSEGEAPGFVYIVWPENAVSGLDESPSALAVLDAKLPQRSVLLTGSVRRERDALDRERYYNALAIVEKTPDGRRVVAHYDKHHLVPFGEYLPFQGLLRSLGLAQLAPFEDGFHPGPGPAVFAAGGSSFAPLICYEAIFPGEIYPRGERPQWLVAVTNDAWFGDTSGPRQHLDQARLRAIETGLPMARSANTGISALIDAKGRLVARIKLYAEGRLDAPLPKPLPPTLYTRIGDGGFYFMLSLVVLFVAIKNKSRARERP